MCDFFYSGSGVGSERVDAAAAVGGEKRAADGHACHSHRVACAELDVAAFGHGVAVGLVYLFEGAVLRGSEADAYCGADGNEARFDDRLF